MDITFWLLIYLGFSVIILWIILGEADSDNDNDDSDGIQGGWQ